MPFWRIAHHPSLFTSAEERTAIATAITNLYVKLGLPAWYVGVAFSAFKPSHFYHGGHAAGPAVGIDIIHAAANDMSDEWARQFKDAADTIMRPSTIDKGIRLEYAVVEAPTKLWRIDGLDPPEAMGNVGAGKKEERRSVLAERERKRATKL